jgi:hypothetical protein
MSVYVWFFPNSSAIFLTKSSPLCIHYWGERRKRRLLVAMIGQHMGRALIKEWERGTSHAKQMRGRRPHRRIPRKFGSKCVYADRSVTMRRAKVQTDLFDRADANCHFTSVCIISDSILFRCLYVYERNLIYRYTFLSRIFVSHLLWNGGNITVTEPRYMHGWKQSKPLHSPITGRKMAFSRGS